MLLNLAIAPFGETATLSYLLRGGHRKSLSSLGFCLTSMLCLKCSCLDASYHFFVETHPPILRRVACNQGFAHGLSLRAKERQTNRASPPSQPLSRTAGLTAMPGYDMALGGGQQSLWRMAQVLGRLVSFLKLPCLCYSRSYVSRRQDFASGQKQALAT